MSTIASGSAPPPSLVGRRSEALFDRHYQGILVRTDRLFAWLMAIQWLFGIGVALIVSPRTWAGSISQVHLHVWCAVFLGGLLTGFPVLLVLRYPGRAVTRHVIACTQMLWSALLIHLTGGRIETHFHVFGSLAILAFYRDWKVFIPATVVVGVDHLLRGIFWPQSVYGVLSATPWRSLEHAAWVVFENIFLIQASRRSIREMWDIAGQRAQLERTNEITEAASRTKSTFLANMSHEIRTPLNGILGFTDLLRRGAESSDAERQEWLSTIQSSSGHLLALINDILDISKIEAGQLEMERVAFSPGEVIAETASLLRPRAIEKNVAFEVTFESPLPRMVVGDPTRFRQVLVNLAGNAIKFTDTGSVKVIARHEGSELSGQLTIDIDDSGVGIPADKLQSVFDPFVQGDPSVTRQFGGTGLGLTISRRIARAFGGDVTVTSEPGCGSTFTFSLPVQCVDSSVVHTPSEATQQRAQAGVALPEGKLQGRILLVEDGETNRKMLSVVLSRRGLEVITAPHGQAGVELARRERFDAILMDMQMPVLDGYAATRILRKEGVTIPIIALTANAMRGDEEQCRAAGCSGTLSKPIDPEGLIATLAACLPGTGWHAPAAGPDAHVRTRDPIVSSLPMDDSEFREIVEEFADSLPQQLAAATNAFRGQNASKLAEIAHAIRGAGGTVGLDVLTGPAGRLEQFATERDWEAIEAAIRDLDDLAERIVIGTKAAAKVDGRASISPGDADHVA